jgi:hypothetical protein
MPLSLLITNINHDISEFTICSMSEGNSFHTCATKHCTYFTNKWNNFLVMTHDINDIKYRDKYSFAQKFHNGLCSYQFLMMEGGTPLHTHTHMRAYVCTYIHIQQLVYGMHLCRMAASRIGVEHDIHQLLYIQNSTP